MSNTLLCGCATDRHVLAMMTKTLRIPHAMCNEGAVAVQGQDRPLCVQSPEQHQHISEHASGVQTF